MYIAAHQACSVVKSVHFLSECQPEGMCSPSSDLFTLLNLRSPWYNLQMGFFTIVGLPMFKAMADVFEGAKPMLEGVMGNYRAWEAAAAAAEVPT